MAGRFLRTFDVIKPYIFIYYITSIYYFTY